MLCFDRVGSDLPHFSAILASKIRTAGPSADSGDSERLTVALSLAREELAFTDQATRASQLGIIVAIFVSFADTDEMTGRCTHLRTICPLTCQETARSGMDIEMTRFSRGLDLTDFGATLDIVWDGLRDGHLNDAQLGTLMRLSSLFMHNAPEGPFPPSLASATQISEKNIRVDEGRPEPLDSLPRASCRPSYVLRRRATTTCGPQSGLEIFE